MVAVLGAGASPAHGVEAEEPPPTSAEDTAPPEEPVATPPELAPATPPEPSPAPPPVAPRSEPQDRPPEPSQAPPVAGEAPAGVAATEEEVAARALERALVERGAVVLPPWRPEASLQLAYAHTSLETGLQLEGGGVVPGRVRGHAAGASLGLRLGLPAKFQIDASIPFLASQQRTNVGSIAFRSDTGPGLGDIRLSLTRHLASTRGRGLQLLVAGSWDAPTGKSRFGLDSGELPRGQGVHALGGSATLVRTSDPIVLLATASYTTHLARDTDEGEFDAADTIGVSLSSLLAVTPTESLALGVDLERGGDDRLGGKKVIGTDRTAATVQVGVSTVLSRRFLLSVAAAFGVTDDAPTFQLGVSVPVRF